MTEIKKIRFIILCLLLVLVGGTSLFIGRISRNVWEAQEHIIEMEEFAQESREEYLDLSIMLQESYIKTIEENWEADLEYYYQVSQERMMSRFEQSLDGVLNQAYSSMIVAIKDEQGIVYTGYVYEEYEEYFETIDWEYVDSSKDLTIIGDLDEPVGESNRLYISGTELTAANRKVEVFVFFEEQIMLDSLIETLSFEMLESTNNKIKNVLAEVVLFMTGVIALSATIALYLRKIYIDTQSKCPYFGNELCHYSAIKSQEMEKHRGY